MNKQQLRIVVYSLIFVLVLNILLKALNILNDVVFWIIIAASGLFAYKIVPKIK